MEFLQFVTLYLTSLEFNKILSFALRYTDQIRWRIGRFSSLCFTKKYYIG